MEQMSQEGIEEKIWILESETLPAAKEHYLELQNQMVERQGFISIKLQSEVECAKNQYFDLKAKLDDLKNILSYLED